MSLAGRHSLSAPPPLPTILEVLFYLNSLGNRQILVPCETERTLFFNGYQTGKVEFVSIQHPSMLRNLEGKPAHGCLALRKDPPISLQTGSRTRTRTSLTNSTYISDLPLVGRQHPEESTYTTIHFAIDVLPEVNAVNHLHEQNACLHNSSHRSTTRDDRRRSGNHRARDGREPQSVESRLGACRS
jgi:hypothetical protein